MGGLNEDVTRMYIHTYIYMCLKPGERRRGVSTGGGPDEPEASSLHFFAWKPPTIRWGAGTGAGSCHELESRIPYSHCSRCPDLHTALAHVPAGGWV